MASKARILLLPGYYSLRNAVSRREALRRAPFGMLGLAFWALLYAGAYVVVSYVREVEFLGELLARRLLGLMFFSLMGFLFLSNLITAISSFYLSRDLQLLRTLPVSDGDILLHKTLKSIASSSWMVLSFMPPVLLAFGVAHGAGIWYYVSVTLAFVLFVVITGGMGIAAAHVLARAFPPGRVRDAMLLSGLLFFLAAYYFVRTTIPGDANDPVEMVNALLAFRVESPAMPSYWVSRAVGPHLWGGRGDWLYAALLASNGAFFLMLSHALGKRLYRGNLDRLVPSGGRKRGPRAGFRTGRFGALLCKDIKLFCRDKGQWSQLLIILALVFVYVYNFKLIPHEAIADLAPFVRDIVLLVNLLLAGMVLSAVAARFIYTAVSLEGRAFWVIRTSPVGIRSFLMGKFVCGAVPVTLLVLAIVAATNAFMGVGGPMMIISAATVLLMGLSISGLGTGLGAMYPTFRYENIAAVSMSLGGLGFMALSFILVLATLLLEAWPIYMFYVRGAVHWPSAVLAGAAIVAVNLCAAIVPMRLGVRSLSYNNPL